MILIGQYDSPFVRRVAVTLHRYDLPFDRRAILDYLDSLVASDRRLVPANEPDRRKVLRIDAVATGLAEKLYERAYEFARRDPIKRDPSIIARVERQIDSALLWLEGLGPSPWL